MPIDVFQLVKTERICILLPQFLCVVNNRFLVAREPSVNRHRKLQSAYLNFLRLDSFIRLLILLSMFSNLTKQDELVFHSFCSLNDRFLVAKNVYESRKNV